MAPKKSTPAAKKPAAKAPATKAAVTKAAATKAAAKAVVAKKAAKKEIKKSAASTKKATTAVAASPKSPKVSAKVSATPVKKSATPAKKSASPSAKKSATPAAKKSASLSAKKSSTPVKKSAQPVVVAATPAAAAVAAPSNEDIILLFRLLSSYEEKAGEKPYVPKAYRDVVLALRAFVNSGHNITSGKVVKGLKSVGPTTADKIDEFIKTGKVARLEELKKKFGNNIAPANVGGDSSSGKSNAAGASSGKSTSSYLSSGKGQIMTADQKAQVEVEELKLSAMTLDQLKQLCRLNGQRVTGTKTELVSLLGSQVVLGAICKCSKCGGGRPRYDPYTGMLSCPGFRDDMDFVYCSATFNNADGSARQPFKWS